MISIREISDDKTSISSTRWAFASVIKFDIFIIFFSIIIFVVCHLLNKPLNESFFYAVGTLLGILTTLVATPKALQGFEPKKKEEIKKESETTDSFENEGK